LLALAAGGALAATSALAQQDGRVIAFRGGTIMSMSQPPTTDGVLVIVDGRISELGSRQAVQIPSGAEIHDLDGKVVMPGFVDTHSHLGRVSGGDRSAALHPEVRTLDGIDIRHDGFKRALAGGITTVNVMSGSGHLMSGQTTFLKLRAGATKIEDWLFCEDPLTEICGGLKMANGTNSIGGKPFPGTRAKSAAMFRALFTKAQEYRRKVEDAEADPDSEAPERDLGLEVLVQVLEGRRIVQHHTHRADDILTVLRIAEEFGYRPVLHHVSDAAKVAEEIARAGAGVSLTVVDTPGGKEEALGFTLSAGAALEAADADVAFNTDDSILDSRLHLRSAALAVRAGMSPQKALVGLTAAGARMLGLFDQVGSLDPGKDADLVVLSGPPLSIYTQIEETWVEGEKVFDRSDPEQREWATGGYRVFSEGGDHHDS
jgi:imidazolonepropionase-like amidohydrolase